MAVFFVTDVFSVIFRVTCHLLAQNDLRGRRLYRYRARAVRTERSFHSALKFQRFYDNLFDSWRTNSVYS